MKAIIMDDKGEPGIEIKNPDAFKTAKKMGGHVKKPSSFRARVT